MSDHASPEALAQCVNNIMNAYPDEASTGFRTFAFIKSGGILAATEKNGIGIWAEPSDNRIIIGGSGDAVTDSITTISSLLEKVGISIDQQKKCVEIPLDQEALAEKLDKLARVVNDVRKAHPDGYKNREQLLEEALNKPENAIGGNGGVSTRGVLAPISSSLSV